MTPLFILGLEGWGGIVEEIKRWWEGVPGSGSIVW